MPHTEIEIREHTDAAGRGFYVDQGEPRHNENANTDGIRWRFTQGLNGLRFVSIFPLADQSDPTEFLPFHFRDIRIRNNSIVSKSFNDTPNSVDSVYSIMLSDGDGRIYIVHKDADSVETGPLGVTAPSDRLLPESALLRTSPQPPPKVIIDP